MTAYFRGHKVDTKQPCPDCDGDGFGPDPDAPDDREVRCPTCKGKGWTVPDWGGQS